MIDKFFGDYRFLSNFYLVRIEHDGMTFPSVEHAYQASKTVRLSLREQFANPAMSPGTAKRMGSKLKKIRPDWDSVRVDIMRDLLRKKFAYVDLREKLLATGSQELVEGNTWGDRLWGVDYSVVPHVGENWLGILLMQVREEIADKVRVQEREIDQCR